MSELQPWVWTDCPRCRFKGSARSIHALVEAMAEHDRHCQDEHRHRKDDDGKEDEEATRDNPPDEEETLAAPRSARTNV